MNVIELRFDGNNKMVQATIHTNTNSTTVAAREYPGKLLKEIQAPCLSIRPGTTIPRVQRVEDTSAGMFGIQQVLEYSLLVEQV